MKKSSPLAYLILSFNLLLLVSSDESLTSQNPCYTQDGLPVECFPEFENIAHERLFEVTNTCGEAEPSEYCTQTGFSSIITAVNTTCDICDARRPEKAHPAKLLTDNNIVSSPTWWQSDSMEFSIQHPNSVSLTINFGKTYVITYVQLKFHSPRPESFAIYKKESEQSDWEPYQYYSNDCVGMYGQATNGIVTAENETVALCTDEFSDISPLTGGNVAFSTLEGRPNAGFYGQMNHLKRWVTATDIKITLNRLNTYGDDIFRDPKVLRSYFYAISDIAIGGRCKCNGHANKCVSYETSNLETKYRCQCEHNTDGVDCERCAPFYNDRPWSPASYDNAHECLPCQCNGLSEECEFNQTLYDQSGGRHGGHCKNCRGNTDGPHCEYCKSGYYRNEYDQCVECQCNPIGSKSQQCDPSGRCSCKHNVEGAKCDRCAPMSYGLSASGCTDCQCNPSGSANSPPVCDPRDGQCRCKELVGGQNCDQCLLGSYGFNANLTTGCLGCFCFGHSNDCKTASNYYLANIDSDLTVSNGRDGWSVLNEQGAIANFAFDETNPKNGIYGLAKSENVWFSAPSKYLGNLRTSYNQSIEFTLRLLPSNANARSDDIVIENSNARLTIRRPFYDQVLRVNSDGMVETNFVIGLSEIDSWRPRLSYFDFHRLLSNVTSIRIRATLNDYTFLLRFKLNSAQKPNKGSSLSSPVTTVEQCVCPTGHTGPSCERCKTGYTRDTPYGDAFVKCVPCRCNNHSISCDPDGGQCKCIHQTTGDNCELCEKSYYGNALLGTPIDCKKCPCPNDGPCIEVFNNQSNLNDVVCLDCPVGTTGNLCDQCDDGFYDVTPVKPISVSNPMVCAKCDCNGNVDENSVGNCDPSNGKCLRCVYNTTGDHCEKCIDSYWGDALSESKCSACECHPQGSKISACDLATGQCQCKPNVIGRQCDQCKNRYWNLSSDNGCVDCRCDPLGSVSLVCDKETGACRCRPGVTGEKCDQCMPYYYGFSADGCTECKCNPQGSKSAQCDESGKCECLDRISGDKCDKCAENYHNFTLGCEPCPECYKLVQSSVGKLRDKVSKFNKHLDTVFDEKNPPAFSSAQKQTLTELEEKLSNVKSHVQKLHDELYRDLPTPYSKSLSELKSSYELLNSEWKQSAHLLDQLESKINNELEPNYNKVSKSITDTKLLLDMIKPYIGQQGNYLEIAKEDYKDYYLSDMEEMAPNLFKLKNLASQARNTSEEQNKLAKEFSDRVEKSLASSYDAINILNTMPNRLHNLKRSLANQPDNSSNELLVKRANVLLKQSAALKQNLNKEAEEIQKVNEQMAAFVVPDYEDELSEANEKLKEIETRIEGYKANLKDMESQVKEALEKSDKEQKTAAENLKRLQFKDAEWSNLLTRSERAKTMADEGLQQATNAFNNASEILNILKDFNNQLEESKFQAEAAMNLTEEIKSSLNGSQTKYSELTSTLEKSNKALRTVENNLGYVEDKTKNNDDSLTKRSSELKQKLDVMDKAAKDLKTDFDKSLDGLDATYEVFKSLPDRIDQLEKGVLKLGDDGQSVLASVKNANHTLTEIETNDAAFLDNYRVSMDDLNRLSQLFDQTSKEIDTAMKVDDDYLSSLEEVYAQNLARLEQYNKELPLIKQHIADLTSLKNSLACRK